ncbi:hypothetical protein MKW98_008929, partial [Papaver atlanticum]
IIYHSAKMPSVLRSVINIAVVLTTIFAFSFELCLCNTGIVRNAFTDKTETPIVGLVLSSHILLSCFMIARLSVHFVASCI